MHSNDGSYEHRGNHTYGPDYDEDDVPRDYNVVSWIAVVLGLMAFLIGALSTGPLTDDVNNLKGQVANLDRFHTASNESNEKLWNEIYALRAQRGEDLDYLLGRQSELWRDLAYLSKKKRVVIQKEEHHTHYNFEKMADTYVTQSLSQLVPYENPTSH